MSRPMRQRFGLPAPERGSAWPQRLRPGRRRDRVVLTRAEKVDGTPTVPSRWLLRLQAVLDGAGLALAPPARDWRALARRIDQPDSGAAGGAAGAAAVVAARPRRLSVTQIATWMQDPYAIYARQVLRLNRLDPIEGRAGGGRARHRDPRRAGRLPAGLPRRASPTRWTGCWRWGRSNSRGCRQDRTSAPSGGRASLASPAGSWRRGAAAHGRAARHPDGRSGAW